MNDLAETRNRGDRPLGAKRPTTERSRGQILILFVMAIFVFTGMVALVIDVSWYWVNSLRVQRAADAAALAGVVQLPTNPGGAGGAYALARAEATKNGYDDASLVISVTPVQQPAVTGRRLEVTVSAPVDMFFMRIFGINQINSTRVARAEFVLPVPMGSPDNWYGVFGPSRGFTSTTTNMVDVHTPSTGNSGLKVPTAITATVPSTAAWAVSGGTLITAVGGNDNVYAQTNTNGRNQIWRDFDLLSGLAANQTATTVNGIQVRLTDAFVNLACAGSFIQVALSYDAGLHWTTATANNRAPTTGSLTTTTSTDYTLGSATAVTAWPLALPAHTWTGNDLGNSNFRVRLTATKGPSPCTVATLLRVDMIQVQANYGIDTVTQTPVTTTTAPVDMPVEGPGTDCTTGVVRLLRGRRAGPQPQWLLGNDEHRGCRERQRRHPPGVLRHARRHDQPGVRAQRVLQLRDRDAPGLQRRLRVRLRPRLLRDRRTTREPATAGSTMTVSISSTPRTRSSTPRARSRTSPTMDLLSRRRPQCSWG